MPISEARKRANKKWNDANLKERYEQINLFVPRGNREVIKKAAETAGVSVNSFIQTAILEKLQITEWPVKSQPSQQKTE